MKHLISIFIAAISIISFNSCESNNDPQPIEPAKPITVTDAEYMAGYANYEFAIRLMNALNEEMPQNTVISPLNIMVNNGIFINGTTDETQREILSALNYEGSVADYNSYVNTVCSALKNIDPLSSYSNKSALWIDESKKLTAKAEFESVLKQNYDIDIFNTYRLFTDPAKDAINEWVFENTDKNIYGVLKETLPEQTVMFEASALYFKSLWKTPFDKAKTKAEIFTCADGSKNEVSMMKEDLKVRATKQEGYSAIKLPMGNKAFSMIIVLPDEGISLEDCSKFLTDRMFRRFYNGYETSLVHISIPKFEIGKSSDLKEAFEKCGIKRIFSNEDGQFNMFEENTDLANKKVCVNFMNQTINFRIDEEGCRAENVVYSGMLDTADLPLAPDGMHFTVNRPFIFMIKENSTPCPLLLGTINYLR